MTANSNLSEFSTYVSGAVVGMVVVLFVLVPHLEAERSAPRPVPVACAARMSSNQVDGLRSAIVSAALERGASMTGGSAYAAAKVGYAPPADMSVADGALQTARAQFCSTCG